MTAVATRPAHVAPVAPPSQPAAAPSIPDAEKIKAMNLHQRINEVRKHVAYIKKARKVESYMAVTHDQVTGELRDPLITFGIIIEPPSFVSSRVADTGTKTAKGVPFIRYEAVYEIDFVNMDDPKDRITRRFEVHALDHGDKAPGKAASYAEKTAMLKMFNIETGEEDELRPTDQQGGLSASAFADWEAKIDDLKTGGAEAETLWAQIAKACEAADDLASCTKLKARITAKLTALKKPGKPADARAH